MSKPDENVYRPCPCGSGEKYKFCCLVKDREQRRQLRHRTAMNFLPGGDESSKIDAAEEAHRRGGALVEHLQGREAIPHLERAIRLCPILPSPYNNLAMAHFIEGDVEKALEICEQVDRVVDPGNVFALGQRVHYLLLLGRRAEAEETGRRMLSLPGRDEFAVYKKCEALARLRRHADVYDTATRAIPSAQDCRESLAFFAGTAAANLARYEEAVRLLEEALDDRTHGRQAESHLDRLRRRQGPGTLQGEWPYLEWGHWTPPRFLERLKDENEARRYPGFAETIGCLLDERFEGGAPLQMLGRLGNPEAIDLLRRVAFGTFGAERLRFEALATLLERGIVSPDEPVRMWMGGEWRTIQARQQEVTLEAGYRLPEELQAPMSEMLAAIKAGNWNEAESLGCRIIERAPESPQALHNLAMVVHHHGRMEEAEALLRRAIAADPSYLFAPASLATMKLAEAKVEEAREILKAVKFSDQLHPVGHLLFLIAQAKVATMEGGFEEAARCWRIAEEIDPDHPAVEVSRRDLARRLTERAAELLERGRERLERQRRRLLSRRPSLEESLEGHTVAQLQDMGRALGLDRVTGIRKDELSARVVVALRNAEAMRAHIRALPKEAREALRQVWASGDAMSYDRFTQAYGPASGKGPPAGPRGRDDRAPLDCLTDLGLVAVGTVGDRVSVLIPPELRAAADAEFSASRSDPLPEPVTGGGASSATLLPGEDTERGQGD